MGVSGRFPQLGCNVRLFDRFVPTYGKNRLSVHTENRVSAPSRHDPPYRQPVFQSEHRLREWKYPLPEGKYLPSGIRAPYSVSKVTALDNSSFWSGYPKSAPPHSSWLPAGYPELLAIRGKANRFDSFGQTH